MGNLVGGVASFATHHWKDAAALGVGAAVFTGVVLLAPVIAGGAVTGAAAFGVIAAAGFVSGIASALVIDALTGKKPTVQQLLVAGVVSTVLGVGTAGLGKLAEPFVAPIVSKVAAGVFGRVAPLAAEDATQEAADALASQAGNKLVADAALPVVKAPAPRAALPAPVAPETPLPTAPAASLLVAPAEEPAETGIVQVLSNLERPIGGAPTPTGSGVRPTGASTGGAPSATAPTATAPAATAARASSRLASRPLGQELTQNSTREHLFQGGTETDPQSPYAGKWDGKGLHDWNSLASRADQDGFPITKVAEDPVTGVRRVTVQRTGVDPKTGAPVTGNVNKTVYPSSFSQADVEAAGNDAFEQALSGQPGSKLEPYGSTTNPDGTPKNGYFESTVQTPKGAIPVQGLYRELPDGSNVIVSHFPRFGPNATSLDSSSW